MSGRGERGLTFIELVVTAALLAILAAAALPLYEVSVKREREIELRFALRSIRRALDEFHKSYIASGGSLGFGVPTLAVQLPGQLPGQPGQQPGQPAGRAPATAGSFGQYEQVPLIDHTIFDPVESRGFPESLQQLVEGVPPQGGAPDEEHRIRFLRRLPLDPLIARERIDANDENGGWGVRCYQDRPEKLDGKCETVVWCQSNVYDAYTKSMGTALDGTKYCEW